MHVMIVAASSLLAVFLALALAREMRIRRALQRILSRLLQYWSTFDAREDEAGDRDDRDGRDRV